MIRSALHGGGFYRTDDPEDIRAYRRECLNKGRSIFAPVKKINRVLNNDAEQISFENNLRVYREAAGMTQSEVCDRMRQYDAIFDVTLLSKMENGHCMPTPYQCAKLAKIYGCQPDELISRDFA